MIENRVISRQRHQGARGPPADRAARAGFSVVGPRSIARRGVPSLVAPKKNLDMLACWFLGKVLRFSGVAWTDGWSFPGGFDA